MKNIKIFLLCLLVLPLQLFAQTELQKQMGNISKITEVQQLKDSANFAEKYLVYFNQQIDHKNAASGVFRQRVVVAHVGFDRPTVIVTEGYGGAYALRTKYREEISKLFNTNMIFVEHRYFLESKPQFADGKSHWEYLTAENSAEDLHAIVTAFKKIYKGKWISTGISKGGQTTMIYRTFFPNDVDFSVPYVGPVCFKVEDGRHEPFLRNVSTPENRKRIQDFQLEALKRKAAILPEFKKYCEQKHLTFNAPLDKIYDYCVLEYSFSMWQWGTPMSEIPASTADDKTIYNHLMKIAGPSYFSKDKANSPFYVQAAHELGYYGYDIKPFKKYLSIKSSKGYLYKLMLPSDAQDIKFDKTLSKKIYKFLEKNDPKMIFIYGQTDPWTAAGVTKKFDNKKNIYLFIQPNGSHRTRISTLPDDMKNKAIAIITKWLAE